MKTAELIETLEYSRSPHFLPATRFGEVREYAHVFRRAEQSCSLRGVYLLNTPSSSGSAAAPVVYIVEANDDSDAERTHRRVWNQNVVPFVIVRTPSDVRLLSGFRYSTAGSPEGQTPQERGILEPTIPFEKVRERLGGLRARAIDEGAVWSEERWPVRPEERVDRRLLANLRSLGEWLHQSGVEDRRLAHGLIGKFVYLRYLRDRGILSDRRLKDWALDPEDIFGRSPGLRSLARLDREVETWLNGAIFPLDLTSNRTLQKKHVEHVASAFLGDDQSTGQRHLHFQAYDFSHIPIETLSIIYEQFLEVEGRSRDSGAYYTPLPLVNLILSEMDAHRPLGPGMKVLDPACGSGAFLVQCYRRLIEVFVASRGRKIRPVELRDLLTRSIFGVDRDFDACRVAELSLLLTMLDYIEPPDLQSTPGFKLPVLQGNNIFEADFFDPDSQWANTRRANYDWIVGNPPWVQCKGSAHRHALRWIREHRREQPVTRNQLAEAFAWRVTEHAAPGALIGLLLPAMTLFGRNPASGGFRERFFARMEAKTVLNLTNLREVLFYGRARLPSAAVFYSPASQEPRTDAPILVFSPLVINQQASGSTGPHQRRMAWSVTVDSSEIRPLDRAVAAKGDNVPWKVVMWGSHHDRRLLARIRRAWPGLGVFARSHDLVIREGLQLRRRSASGDGEESTDPIPTVTGEHRLDVRRLRRTRRSYSFPKEAIEPIPAELAFVRKGRGEKPLAVCRPPHVIVGAARNFAVYSDDFIVVPPRQIGIAGPGAAAKLLKALSLYLSSDVALYCEFFAAPQWGVRGRLGTKESLEGLPVPLEDLDDRAITEWCRLHAELVAASEVKWSSSNGERTLFSQECPNVALDDLEEELNRKVDDLLGLRDTERWLVHDLVHLRMGLVDGVVTKEASSRPERVELEGYGAMLREELDAFLGSAAGAHHEVRIIDCERWGAVRIDLIGRDRARNDVQIDRADQALQAKLELLQWEHGPGRQWLYFDRNLTVYTKRSTYLFKPWQRFWWSRSQAINDADEIVAAALAPRD